MRTEPITVDGRDRIGGEEISPGEGTLAALDRVAHSMPGFAPRDGQRRMALEIAATLSSPNAVRIAAIESQTGTGKTIGYLLGAIPAARAAGKKLVIATATAALQEQLLARGLPAVIGHSGLSVKAVVAKGRGRYVCPARLDAIAAEDPDQIALFGAGEHDGGYREAGAAEGAHGPGRPDARAVHDHALRWQQALRNGTWDGCRDSLEEDPDGPLWAEVTSTARTCTSARCSRQRACPFFRARWAMADADVIVANHDLVLADLALGGGAVLPAPDQTIYVFDEGHQLPEKAVAHGAASASLAGLRDLGTRIPRALQALPRELRRPDVGGTLDALGAAVCGIEAVVERLPLERTREGVDRYRWAGGEVDGRMADPVRALGAVLRDLESVLAALSDGLASLADGDPARQPHCEVLLPQLGALVDRIAAARDLATRFVAPVPEKAPPVARWVERRAGRIVLHAAPVSAAGWLRQALWEPCYGAVVTSATLTSLNRWGRFTARTGLPAGVRFLRLPSPFDYRRADLVVPWMEADGGRPDAHTEAIATRIPALLQAHPVATLCLFSSRAQLAAVRRRLPQGIASRVRCQGDMSRDALIAAHRAAVEAGEPAVIFGLASFAEGIDLPGKACEHVIIAKLPFAPPDSPIEAARAEWLERQGRNPFMALSVPDAAFRLTQACGRLMRTEQDCGRITILDRRLVARRYGTLLLDALPRFRRVVEPGPGGAGGRERSQNSPSFAPHISADGARL